jgi:nucleoside-diphosphate-sugar epimerase
MKIFLTGGTGYIGSRLIPILKQRGHELKALVRKGSEKKLPTGITGVLADPVADGFLY